MRCEPFSHAVLDDRAPRPAGFAEHVAGCAACRALLALEGLTLPAPPRTPVGPVVRRAAVAVGLLGLVAFALIRPQPVSDPAQRPSTSLGELALTAPAPAPSLEALAFLNHTVTRYARVDPTAHGYGPRFGSLPQLLAPSPITEESP